MAALRTAADPQPPDGAPPQASRRMRQVASLAIFFVLVQIALGGAVRLTGSGLSCPDWPLCYGFWWPTPEALATVPDLAYTYGQVWLEWGHRVNAAVVVAPLVLLVLVTAPTLAHRWLGLAASGLVGVQALLGGVTVLDRNSPGSVAAHLTAALVLLVVLAGAATRSRPAGPPPRPRLPPGCRSLAWVGVALALAAAGAGALLAKSGAAPTCPDWPFCGRPWTWAHYADPDILLHLAHRTLALAAALPALLLAIRIPRRRAPAAFAWAAGAVALFGCQSLLGLLTAVAEPGLGLALAHQVAGAVLIVAYAAAGWSVARAR